MVNFERGTSRNTEGGGERTPSPSSKETRKADRQPVRNIVIRTPANRFDINEEDKDPGMDYRWVSRWVRGKEDTENWNTALANGWVPCRAGSFRSFTGAPEDSTEQIERGGSVLCERAKEISDMSRAADKKAAVDQLQTQLARLEGRAKATQSQSVTQHTRTYEPILDE